MRAPDNVLYLTNFWSMKGYDACVFPRDGEPVLICLEASAEDAERERVDDGRPLRARLRRDRPAPGAGAHARGRARGGAHGRVGLELSLGTQASDRMVGEPTTFTKAWFDAFPDAADATPLLARARDDQDRAGDRAAPDRERDRGAGDAPRPPAARSPG